MNSNKYWDLENKKAKYCTLESFIEYIKANKKRKIIVTSNEEIAGKDNDSYEFFDGEHGCFILNPDLRLISDLYISKEFFEANKDKIIETLREVVFNLDIPYISKEIYDESFIKTLVLTADTIEFAPDVKPSNEIISFLSENHIAAYTKEGSNKKSSLDVII